MEKTLRLLGLAAVFCTVAVVAAQRGDEGAAVAAKQSEAREPYVVQALSSYIITRSNFEIALAEENRRNELIDPLIFAQNLGYFSAMTPAQQKYQLDNVLEIGKYRPHDRNWGRLKDTPSMLNHLLKVDKATNAKIEAFSDEQSRVFNKPYDDMMAALMKTQAWKNAKTRDEQNVLIHEANQKLLAGRSSVSRWKAAFVRTTKLADYADSLLSGEAKKEFRAIRARADGFYEQALSGKMPSL